MKRIVAGFIIWGALTSIAAAQAPDSIRATADTIVTDTSRQKEGFFKKDYPNPKKAALMSLVIPGAGQVYNGRWWKIPFVYGALGGMVYLIRTNSQLYDRLSTAYQLKLQGKEHEFSGTSIDNARTLRSLRDEYDKNKQLSYIGLVFVYMLNGLEAFVDAHLQSFDISEDLSLQLKPELHRSPVNEKWKIKN
jgi:hypothetical protein